MSTRLLKSLSRLLLPILVLLLIAVVSGAVWLVYTSARPIKARYLVTPDKYGQLSTRAAQVTAETWLNRDGTTARGWLLRGIENGPAVILLHKSGADRSYTLNLGVKVNESTNFTVLMPDQRGHGEDPLVQNGSFGGCEAEDAGAAIDFVRSLKTPSQISLVGKNLGVYGVEMGAIVAISAAAKDLNIKAIAADSVPYGSNEILKATVERRFAFASFATSRLAQLGTRLYYFDGCYDRSDACDTARKIENRSVLLLAGLDQSDFQESTSKLSKCFPANNKLTSKTDLSPSGFSIMNASMEQSETYDQRLIDFFRASLSGQ